MDILTSYVTPILLFSAVCVVSQDLEPTVFVVTSSDPDSFTAGTDVPTTFDVTVRNNGPGDVVDSATDNIQVQLFFSDNVQQENAVDSMEINDITVNSADLSQAISAGDSITLSGLTSTVNVPVKHCPLFNYLCVVIDVEGSPVNDSDLTNNDKCIKFGPRLQGMAGESPCVESPMQSQVDNGVVVVLSSFSMTLWPSNAGQYRTDVANAVNGYCKLHDAECCGNNDIGDNTADIVDAKNVFVAGGYPRRRTGNSLSVLTFVDVEGGNTFCSVSSDFILPQDALLAALQEGQNSFTLTVKEVRVGDEEGEEEEDDTMPVTKMKELLLNGWQIGITVTIILFGIVGLGTLLCLAIPWRDKEPFVEVPIYEERKEKKSGRSNVFPVPYEQSDPVVTAPNGESDDIGTVPRRQSDQVVTAPSGQRGPVVTASSGLIDTVETNAANDSVNQAVKHDEDIPVYDNRRDRNSGGPVADIESDTQIELQNLF
ncbi:uncharacterized protein LOC144437862 [Glandiceps talaboti]